MMTGVPRDLERVRSALASEAVSGVDDFGHFVNDTTHLRPSGFDEKSAMRTLVALLPTLIDRKVVEATAGHLGRSWARPAAFPALLAAFRDWDPRDWATGGAIGDSLVSTAKPADLDSLLEIATHEPYGRARQMIVDSLWRYRKDERVAAVLINLAEQPDVCLHAMNALRRAIGNDAAIPFLLRLTDPNPDENVRKQATSQLKKAQKAAART
jgi:hypothetical protein